MPSSTSSSKRPKSNRNDGPTSSRFSSAKQVTSTSISSFIKWPFIVLLISLGIFYLCYTTGINGNNHDHELQAISTKLDLILNSAHQTLQQWTRPILSRARGLLGLTIRPDAVLRGLLNREESAQVRANSAIAIGLGACTDLIVESLEIFEKFAAPSAPKPHAQIESMQDLLELYAYYFKHGAASERYIKSKPVFDQLLALIRKSPHIWKKNIGGNAPLMSERFHREGIDRILLGAQVSSEFADQLPETVQISGPMIKEDDYHILLEYKTGQRWGPYKSPRANRLIVHSDDNNVQLIARPTFFQQAAEFRPNLLIISGLQFLDNSPLDFDVRTQTVRHLSRDLHQLRQSLETVDRFNIHFEFASYTEERLIGIIAHEIFPHVDSFGMNEQEVTNLLSYLKHGNISFATNPFPRIAAILDDMRELFSILTGIGDGRVSRIHVHTLPFQVVAVRVDQENGKWPNSAAAMAKASLTAYRHTCGNEEVNLQTARILLDESFSTSAHDDSPYKQRIYFDSSDPTACWTEELPNLNRSKSSPTNIRVQFCLAVGMVCTSVIKTGGGGDNVSAGGLVLQI